MKKFLIRASTIGLICSIAACGASPREVNRAKNTAYQEGYEEGLASGRAEGASSLERIRKQTKRLSAQVTSLKQTMKNFAANEACVTYEELRNERVSLTREYGC